MAAVILEPIIGAGGVIASTHEFLERLRSVLSQENAPMKLQYMPDTGGDVANENYCVPSSNSGDANSPCAGARVTPGAVQFYMPAGSCMSQNA